jgi:ABC-2 type transport system permease protein
MAVHLKNIYRLGIKELWSLWRDPVMILLIVWTFSASVYVAATAVPETLYKTPIAIVDEDHSALSERIGLAFYPPRFTVARPITLPNMDQGLDSGVYMFVLNIPPNFQRDVLAGRSPRVQLNIDATKSTIAYYGSGVVQQIVTGEADEFLRRYRGSASDLGHWPLREGPPVDVALRSRFNPNLDHSWFGSIMEIINNITILAVILTGAALIREREHGTVEHLLVMPVTPTEIMLAKIWPNALVVLVAVTASLYLIVHGALQVPLQGQVRLFLAGTALHLFAATALGIFIATYARNMPQLGLLVILTLIPLNLLSGTITPRESMPKSVQQLMSFSPTTYFVDISQAILYRGGGIEAVWKQFVIITVIGIALFTIALRRFRRTIGTM